MKANLDISEKNLKAVAESLNILLADEHILYIKTRNYHWNVEGPSFMEFHKFFEEQYNTLEAMIDEIAERIRFIGQYSEGRLKEYLKVTNLQEQDPTTNSGEQLKNLLDDHETICQRLHKEIPKFQDDYNDPSSTDFITGILNQHEKMAWMLRAYLNNK